MTKNSLTTNSLTKNSATNDSPLPSVAPTASYRAVVCHRYGTFDELQMQTLQPKPIAPHQVRLAVAYTGVSFAHSLVVAGLYQRKPPLPFTPGTEASGTVIEVGAQVEHVRIGDRVCAVLDWGGYAQQAVVDAVGVFKLPDELSLDEAITLPISYGTAYGALLWRAKLQAQQTVLILGAAGGIGLAAAEITRALGAQAIVVVNSDTKAQQLRESGFEHIIDAQTTDIRQAVQRITDQQGVDVVFDPIGGDLTHEVLRCLADDGKLLSVGYAAGAIPSIPANILLLKNISVMGFNWGQYVGWGRVDERQRYAARVKAAVDQIMTWWCEGLIHPRIYRSLPLGEFAQAMRLIQNRETVGRIVLDTSQ